MDTNPNAIQNIVIVGGGTSGWMSAAYLNKALNGTKVNCKIRLIEASDITPIGVGEATVPTIAQVFQFLELPEEEWMEACNATYKMAIKFSGWYDNQPSDAYWHTFGTISPNQGANISLTQHWLRERKKGYEVPFAKAVRDSVQLCEHQKAPKIPFEKGKVPYAFHLDAGLLADLLKKKAIEGGVEHLVGKVENANLDEKGFIKSLDTNTHGRLEGDLFIDCSGFSALLIEKAMKEPWVSYADSLLVDSAIAIGTSYAPNDPYNEQNGGLKPYTTATAQKSGWTWHTPLVTRDGNGYVYSSQFASATAAETEFRQFLGAQANGAEAKHLKMRVGKFKRSWVKNCVSIGLSGGFIEPLESTGIALIQFALQNLVYNFPDKSFDAVLLNNFNERLNDQYEHIRDFIVLHYCITQREDTPFWKAVKYDTVVPDRLQNLLNGWKYLWPNGRPAASLMFGPYNYVSILAGMNYLPQKSLPMLDFYDSKQDPFNAVQEKGAKLVESHPTQAEYFKKLSQVKEFHLDESW